MGCNPVPPACVDGLKAQDNCSGEVEVVCSAGEVAGEACARSQIFTYTATDACGNAATGTVTYTWKVDTEAPAFNEPLPQDDTVSASRRPGRC